jgi:hypothetical protein
MEPEVEQDDEYEFEERDCFERHPVLTFIVALILLTVNDCLSSASHYIDNLSCHIVMK